MDGTLKKRLPPIVVPEEALALLEEEFNSLQEVGRGAMSIVYRGVHKETGDVVALKVLPEGFHTDPDAVRRFWREEKLANLLDHPNIVRTRGFRQKDAYYFIEMEYVDGPNLKQVLAERTTPFHEREALRLVIPLCEALSFAHEKGIIHRDVKPANVMVDKKEHVKLTDFGTANLFASGQGARPYAAATLSYVSPEQLVGNPPDPRSDLYSLAATIYEMLWGEPPIQGGDLDRILTEKPDQIPGISDAMNGILLKCLQKKPGQRLQSAEDMKAALEDLKSTLL